MKLHAVVTILASLTASASGFTSYRPVYERDLNRGEYLPRDYSIQARGNLVDAALARRNLERRAALFEDGAIYSDLNRRAPLERYLVLKARAVGKKEGSPSGGSKSAAGPSLPAGADSTKLHVWTRLDTRPTTYEGRSGATHNGLNKLMQDTSGRHVDLVVGSPKSGFNEYGLMFADRTWLKKDNADGAPVSAYTGTYGKTTGETFEYKGKLDGRSTLKSVETKGKSYASRYPRKETNISK